MAESLALTPLHSLHLSLGARMGAFAGFDMPIQYPAGILAEHAHTRAKAGLFDVSHMGQAFIEAPSHARAAAALETLCAADVAGLAPGRQRYSQWLNDSGGVIDDFMVTRPPGADGLLFLVVNASRKGADFALLRAALPADVKLNVLEEQALIALQGPKAADVLKRRTAPEAVDALGFMAAAPLRIGAVAAFVSRSGYTGEDGFEISLPASDAEAFAKDLLQDPDVLPIGLGARDSLRLEAGLCLYGHELDETIDPVEAALVWSIGKRRRGEGGFPGAARIQASLRDGPARKRVGLRLDGRLPAREGAAIHAPSGEKIGHVTSGGFAPSLGAAIAMGFVERAFAATGQAVTLAVRDKFLPATVAALPFHPHSYKR